MGSRQISGLSTPVVCGTCHTLNRDSAKFCSGCTAKLSAFYASRSADLSSGHTDVRASTANGFAEPSAGALTTKPQAELEQAVQALRLPLIWSTMIVVLLFVAFASWYAGYSSVARTPVSASAVAPMVVASPVVVPGMPPFVPDMPVTTHVAVQRDSMTTTEAPLAAETSSPRTQAQPQKVPPAKPRGTRAPPAEPLVRAEPVAPVEPLVPAGEPSVSVAIARQPSGSPLAHCVGFNFFERAICLNNRCAQASSASHPECAEILRQRRLEEARRNPTMSN